ncbi:three-Cys-motif partner protein TcmP [Spirosoma utsteinense]|uniref:Three-Cys-motif partner protein n=1 Tax=Spirosoma utsteinense TaxID=2585773 RepID=A0ABR6W8W4_9BACT|nr:three-Cys-motif partner protein TcmP [Spirosoma utsteinense]MBC3787328.1 three-Cys-motif partner protein [Spirosoma utsteinense]MBC3793014.1 three-Cys-motif partner protein [Spirosoma utsteinense]
MSRAPELTATEFFKVPQPHSLIKADIVSKYIISWAKIIIKSNLHFKKDSRAYVVDLFSGAGKYDNGEKSTPVKLIEAALEIPYLKENVVFRFNDESLEMIKRLEKNIKDIPNCDNFSHPIKCTNFDAESEEVFSWFVKNAKTLKIPMCVFIDPFGYKQISRNLLKTIIQVPQSDIIFFFNYKRINAALGNEQFESNMDKIFGDLRVQNIKREMETAKPIQRSEIIIRHLNESLNEIGAKYVVPYVVVPEDDDQISHYIVGVTKHTRGYELFKKIMKQHSKIGLSAKSKFGHDLASLQRDKQQTLFEEAPDPINDLSNQLKKEYANSTVAFGVLYKSHHPTTNFTESEYKDSVRRLLANGQALIAEESETPNRKTTKGQQSIPNYLVIKFL